MGLLVTVIVFMFITRMIREFERLESESRKQSLSELQEKKVPVKIDSPSQEAKESRSSLPAESVSREQRHSKLKSSRKDTRGSKAKISKKAVLNGIIMAEILSPPKCKRR